MSMCCRLCRAEQSGVRALAFAAPAAISLVLSRDVKAQTLCGLAGLALTSLHSPRRSAPGRASACAAAGRGLLRRVWRDARAAAAPRGGPAAGASRPAGLLSRRVRRKGDTPLACSYPKGVGSGNWDGRGKGIRHLNIRRTPAPPRPAHARCGCARLSLAFTRELVCVVARPPHKTPLSPPLH